MKRKSSGGTASAEHGVVEAKKRADGAALEAALGAPDVAERLEALRKLCASVSVKQRRGTNLHVHTNESFSVFRSPSEAVWQAVQEGVAVIGINDHYTVAGHDEFRRACEIARLPATFSIEAVAMDRSALARGELVNDPANPGRTYLCGKGVTGVLAESARPMRVLAGLRAALERRNREMTDKVRVLFRERLGDDGPSWADVVALTPRGNATERHVSKAVLLRLGALAGSGRGTLGELVGRCCGSAPPSEDSAAMENFIRAKLLKAGAPCYAEEAAEAFLSLEEMRDLFLALGSIPTYPVLLDPVTDAERDVEALLRRLEKLRFFALEVIPHRNTRARLAALMAAAKARWWPVFNGTEHNTPDRLPMLATLSLDAEFLPWFESSAAVLLGHQHESRRGRMGFVRGDGTPMLGDARDRFGHFEQVGRTVWRDVEERSRADS